MKDETLEKLREAMKLAADHHNRAAAAASSAPRTAVVHAILALDERLAAIMGAVLDDEDLS